MSHDFGPALQLFFVLQILGASLFIITIICLVVCHVRLGHVRHATFYSFCVAWVLYGSSHALLVLAGQKPWDWNAGPQRQHRILCTVQAALINPSASVAVTSALAMLLHLLCEILGAILDYKVLQRFRKYKALQPLLVILPWCIWLGLFVAFLVYGLRQPRSVMLSEHHTYCVLRETPISSVTPIYTATMSVLTITVEAVVACVTFKYREIICQTRQAMVIRAALFTIGLLVSVGLGATYATVDAPGIIFDVLLACLPVLAAIIFGSQMDLMFCLLPINLEKLENTLRSMSSRSSSRHGRQDEETGVGQTVIDTKIMMDADYDEIPELPTTWTIQR